MISQISGLSLYFKGMAIGYGILALLYGYIVFTSDWKKYAEIAHERSKK